MPCVHSVIGTAKGPTTHEFWFVYFFFGSKFSKVSKRISTDFNNWKFTIFSKVGIFLSLGPFGRSQWYLKYGINFDTRANEWMQEIKTTKPHHNESIAKHQKLFTFKAATNARNENGISKLLSMFSSACLCVYPQDFFSSMWRLPLNVHNWKRAFILKQKCTWGGFRMIGLAITKSNQVKWQFHDLPWTIRFKILIMCWTLHRAYQLITKLSGWAIGLPKRILIGKVEKFKKL